MEGKAQISREVLSRLTEGRGDVKFGYYYDVTDRYKTRQDAVNGWLDFEVDSLYLNNCIKGKAIMAKKANNGDLCDLAFLGDIGPFPPSTN